VILLGPRPPETGHVPLTSLQVIWSIIPFIGIFYAHAYWLMPVYLFRRRRLTYFLLLIGMMLAAALISGIGYYLNIHPAGHTYPQAVGRRLMASVFFLLASASLGAFRENFRLEREKKEKETEHLRTELSFLRGQVNPHFMLNVLNSMVLMARKRSEMLEPALLELAGLMNYMLYEAANEKIRLEDEIEYLRVYIDLQMLRFRDDVIVQFNTPPAIGDQYVEPMLLIPIVENAFKHGIGLVASPLIEIDIAILEKKTLRVTVKNKFSQQVREEGKKESGIGLINLRKRLDLIYPGRYDLNIVTSYQTEAGLSENWFEISLNIPLE
jgi:sensor histidine kinase YesM